jgi:two-component system chemotaxis response regulator CheB
VEQEIGPRGFAVVAVGASYGGVEAMQRLFAHLPATVPAAIFAVLHVGPHASQLAELLNNRSTLPARHARHGDLIRPGNIYVAPPDHHLLIRRQHMALSRGPRENWTRPAIDPLFRSAARSYGPAAVGVILTGRLNDGTAGLFDIKRKGGITIVQDPSDALCPAMPSSALKHVAVDHCVGLADMSRILFQVSNEIASSSRGSLRAAAAGGRFHA